MWCVRPLTPLDILPPMMALILEMIPSSRTCHLASFLQSLPRPSQGPDV